MISTDAMIFNRISWLEFYGAKPLPEGQEIASGASKSQEDVDADNNFLLDENGKAHGLVKTQTLNMGRLGARGGESFMFGTVVSVAPHPDGVRQGLNRTGPRDLSRKPSQVQFMAISSRTPR